MLKKLFGTKAVVESIVDKDKGLIARTLDGIDNLKLTEEEREKLVTERRRLTVEYLESLKPFKLMQRRLVTAITVVWVLGAINYFVALWIGNPDTQKKILDFILSQYIYMPMSLACTLYLAGGVMESRRRSK